MDFRKDSIGDPTYDEGLASLEKEPDTAAGGSLDATVYAWRKIIAIQALISAKYFPID